MDEVEDRFELEIHANRNYTATHSYPTFVKSCVLPASRVHLSHLISTWCCYQSKITVTAGAKKAGESWTYSQKC